MVKVDSFYFGNIIIDGKKFDNDVIVCWDGEIIDRIKSHSFTKEEFQNILMKEPETVIVGIGTGGIVKVEDSVQVSAKTEGVELIIKKTPEAVEEFNKLAKKKKVVAMFHLTC